MPVGLELEGDNGLLEIDDGGQGEKNKNDDEQGDEELFHESYLL